MPQRTSPESAGRSSDGDGHGLGLPIDGFDAQIAAICRVRGAALATRNLADFRQTGVDLTNPWEAGELTL